MLFKKSLILFSLIILMQGCLVFHTVSYEVNLDDEKSGTVILNVSDIRSDAMNTSELEEDKNQLFNFILESDEFVQQMSEEGKFILDRKLFISDGKLSGTLKYSFDDVSKVEGIVYQEPFYFITIPLEDSIISTNGEVIISEGHKRIMWDNTIRTLKFKMFSVDVNKGSLVELTKYLED
ncbi:MAG: hypothetical protein MUC75_05385 [Ignavibacteriaceae bacterium]|nr:hypothetical protein [Ignavibacteriaceae bacterium]